MRNKLLLLISIVLFYLLLFSMEAWFLAYIPTWVTGVIEIGLIWLMLYYKNRYYENNVQTEIRIIVICLAIAIFWNHMSSWGTTISSVFSAIIMCVLLQFSEEDRVIILKRNTMWFSILLTISITAWLIHVFYSPLKSYGPVYRAGEFYLLNHNYLYFTELISDPDRFKSVFLEPGHVSMIATFFVAANRFDFRNIFVLLISLCIIPTFGLAGYVLFIIGYALYSIENNRIKTVLKRAVPVVTLAYCAFMFFQEYNGGNNLFNDLIVNRLEYDEEKGVVGNDRASIHFETAFDTAVKNGEILIGISEREFKSIYDSGGVGSGAIVYMLQHGIIGSFFLLFSYFLISKKSKYKRWAFFMFLIYAISFLQRVYFFWAAYYIPFICSLAVPPVGDRKETETVE
ncbi:MAG: hypothetical protein HUK11_05210 [Muribaculaceae bacterium]|nr:hypothetical protein [Muribaculaceae bacterium]